MLTELSSGDLVGRENAAPPDAELLADPQFLAWYRELHAEYTPRQRVHRMNRAAALERAHHGVLPQHALPSAATEEPWTVTLPSWCEDQRNLMSCPSDDLDLVVKGINSGAPAVLLDLEDSVVNEWRCIDAGSRNIISALRRELPGVRSTKATLYVRVRGLHVSQRGIIPEELTSASLFDLARIWYGIDIAKLTHPLAVSIPKSESADEAFWWRDLFETLAVSRGLPPDYIKCMVIDESHPLAYELEEFAYILRDHVLGLTLGRLDYMASLIHFNIFDPAWVLPDRNSIPHDVEFYQRLRHFIVDISHKHGMLAIGGMTALFPDRSDPVLNARALSVLENDKRNEAACFMDGAWTGHPDQNEIALRQFPCPNQRGARRSGTLRYPELRVVPTAVGRRTLAGTRAAISSILNYRCCALGGKGVARIDGYMEDMATERIYRLMVAQRMRHSDVVPIMDGGTRVIHDRACITGLFDQEVKRAIEGCTKELIERYEVARRISQEAIFGEMFDSV
jgi:malate synthase